VRRRASESARGTPWHSRGTQVPSKALRCHPRHSGAIRGIQVPSEALRCHPRHSGAIRGTQGPSEALRGPGVGRWVGWHSEGRLERTAAARGNAWLKTLGLAKQHQAVIARCVPSCLATNRFPYFSQPMFIIRHPRHRTGVHTDAVTISSGTPGPPIITAILDQPPGRAA
jgi:hypothetical protein